MRKFNDFGIILDKKSFTGEKIGIRKILNKQIIVHEFVIEPSNFKGDRLKLQITFNDDKRIVFCGSTYLMDGIKKVPADGFPFTATIVELDEHFEFQ